MSQRLSPGPGWRREFAGLKRPERSGEDFMVGLSKRLGWEAFTEDRF
jgi:hypothetical protein